MTKFKLVFSQEQTRLWRIETETETLELRFANLKADGPVETPGPHEWVGAPVAMTSIFASSFLL